MTSQILSGASLPGPISRTGFPSRQDLPQHGTRCCQGHAAETIPAGHQYPLGTGRGQGLRPCGPLLRVILLVAVWGSREGIASWGSGCCQQTKPHRERRGCHHACLLSPRPDGTQSLVQGQEPSQQLTAVMGTAPQTLPCDPGHLLATPSAG